jgi:endonuclease-3
METTNDLRKKAEEVHRRLIESFGIPKWEKPESALDELISTILSQNTNDRNRDTAFRQLKKRFPSWYVVRDADLGEVIDAIRTAGLANQKGARIQEILRQITRERGELDLQFLSSLPPEDVRSWIMHFKGVGPKTASIVMQFALGHPAFPVDTHIYRVSGRLGLRPLKMSVDQAHDHLARLFEPSEYGPVHLNLIRLGREICHPHNPECAGCPIQRCCDYYNELRTSSKE